MANKRFTNTGQKRPPIEVRISNRIIELFSEGLYSSPNKAVEELVSNAFDAGANHVHALISPDLLSPEASLIVIDDGTGMDESGLRQHWIIGVSNKRQPEFRAPKGRKQIGKFGIGKLATYVLANQLTHVCKAKGIYYVASIDYRDIQPGEENGIYTDKRVTVPLRILTEVQAKELLEPWLEGTKQGYKAIPLFGRGAASSWTVAIMTDLKPMASDLRIGRLTQVLRTAMPLRDDFELYVNGDRLYPSKLGGRKIGPWVLGKDLVELGKPAPDDLEVSTDKSESKDSVHHFGLVHPVLGRISGYAEVHDSLLTSGKSTKDFRSHGFFVYVHNRLVNIEDEYFGIDRNLLRHGTFSRFRMVVHIDRLDRELRSSREAVREGELIVLARNILQATFNFARNKALERDAEQDLSTRISNRVAATPSSLARLPLIALISAALSRRISPRYVSYPADLKASQREEFVLSFQQRALAAAGPVTSVQLGDLAQEQGIALYDASSGQLTINSLHPFVAHFLSEYEDPRVNLPLELLAISEVLTEAHLYQISQDEAVVRDVMEKRDELLRYLARSSGKRTGSMIAADLMESLNDKSEFENQLVAAFDSMGFDAVPKGGKGKPDGLADAHLAASAEGKKRSYRVSLEAKSKEDISKKVAAKTVNVSAIARQRDDFECDHALVVGPDFPTTQGELSALVKEITAENKASGKTITLMRAIDFSKLVRTVPLKVIGLDRVRELFLTCKTPEQCKAFVDSIDKQNVAKPPYKAILHAISSIQQHGNTSEPVEYSAVTWELKKRNPPINLTKQELIDICKAFSRMAPGLVFAHSNSVELNQRPDKVLETVRATVLEYPEEEQKHAGF